MSIRHDVINSAFVNWLVEHTKDPTTITFSPTGYCMALAGEKDNIVSFGDCLHKPIDQQTYLGLKVCIDSAQADLFKVS